VIMKKTNSRAKPWQQIAQGVFLRQLFDEQQCATMLRAIKNQSDGESLGSSQPNSMQEYGVVVDEPELAGKLARLANEQLKEEIKVLFPSFPHYEFSEHYAFLTSYGEDANQDLSLHVDASHLTLNICLDSNIQGSDLVFTGSRCRQHLNDAPDRHPVSVRFERGDALLHLGNQRHFVTTLTSGRRHNLVIWYRLEGEECDHNNRWIRRPCPVCRKLSGIEEG
jgi:hypothetical protein